MDLAEGIRKILAGLLALQGLQMQLELYLPGKLFLNLLDEA
jgi:hypothetical protein